MPVSCRRAARCCLSLVARFLVSVVGLLVMRSSSRYSVRSAACLPCAVFASVKRCGRRGGFACRPLLAWMWLAGECVDCVDCLFSVDCFGGCGYIVCRALMVSSFSISWRLAFVRAAQFLAAPHIALAHAPKSVPPGYDESDFFIDFHPISSNLPTACLLVRFFATRLLAYPYRPAPRPAIIDTIGGDGMTAIRATDVA